MAACGRWGFESTDSGSNGDPDAGIGDASLPEGRWTAVSTSYMNACGITGGGELWCWGSNLEGRLGISQMAGETIAPTRVGTASDWTAIAVGGEYQCGLRAGELYCWGRNYYLALGTGPLDELAPAPTRVGADAWQAIATDNFTTCGIRDDGSLWCWGRNESGQLGRDFASTFEPMAQIGSAREWSAVSVGKDHACALKGTELYCWGSNGMGQLGAGERGTERWTITAIAPAIAWTAVSAGVWHTCAISDAGESYCWGVGWNGRLGIGAETDADVPVRTAAPALHTIDAGDSHTCGVTLAGALWCWGKALRGAIAGIEDSTIAPREIVASGITQVDVDGLITCVVDDAAHILCSGQNAAGQTGQPPGVTLALERADTRTDWASITAQRNHACGTTAGGETYCWGLNNAGQLGDGTAVDRQSPVPIGSGFTFVQPGWSSTIARKGLELYLWGWDGTDTSYEVPMLQNDETASAAVGADHSCGRDLGGSLHCTGQNDNGQLGDGTKTPSDDVVVPGTWLDVYAGAGVTCATRGDGSTHPRLYCWGDRTVAGVVSADDVKVPTRLELPDEPVRDVQFGDDFGCARIGAGELWCWGTNGLGRLGLGDYDDRIVPARVGSRSDWRDVDLGDLHGCAIAADRSLWCWGHADQGQSGPVTWDSTVPVQLPGTDWVDVAASWHNTCAIKLDGTRYCGGSNENGELGNGRAWTPTFAPVP